MLAHHFVQPTISAHQILSHHPVQIPYLGDKKLPPFFLFLDEVQPVIIKTMKSLNSVE